MTKSRGDWDFYSGIILNSFSPWKRLIREDKKWGHSQGLPGWAIHPPRGTNWGRKWGKMGENNRRMRKWLKVENLATPKNNYVINMYKSLSITTLCKQMYGNSFLLQLRQTHVLKVPVWMVQHALRQALQSMNVTVWTDSVASSVKQVLIKLIFECIRKLIM